VWYTVVSDYGVCEDLEKTAGENGKNGFSMKTVFSWRFVFVTMFSFLLSQKGNW